ncbi:MAG: hypothetical protein DBP00_07355 [gamma proteobacterium symbiont of Ctena orbiculata]|nr:MAG: hypothetical protein DBP00_07355 [gamma proteobacterium symbiont of Ctena orbiculata]
MTEKKKETRPAPISYRPPVHLADEFHARVEKSGLSYNAFITKNVFDEPPPKQSRRPSLVEKYIARSLGMDGRLRDIFREIRLRCSGNDIALLTEEGDDILIEKRTEKMKLMGRKP